MPDESHTGKFAGARGVPARVSVRVIDLDALRLRLAGLESVVREGRSSDDPRVVLLAMKVLRHQVAELGGSGNGRLHQTASPVAGEPYLDPAIRYRSEGLDRVFIARELETVQVVRRKCPSRVPRRRLHLQSGLTIKAMSGIQAGATHRVGSLSEPRFRNDAINQPIFTLSY